MKITDEAVQTGFEGYMRIVDFFDKDDTAGSFLKECGEGGFLGAIDRMAREIDRLREAKPVDVAAVREGDEAELLKRLIKWDKDYPVNCWNGYAGLKELDRIIADASAALSAEPAQGEQDHKMYSALVTIASLIGNVDLSIGNGANSALIRGELLNDIRAIASGALPAAPTPEAVR